MSAKENRPQHPCQERPEYKNVLSRKGKGSENKPYFQEPQGEMPTPQLIHYQRQRISEYLARPSEKGATRMMIARAVGVERANVCRRVAELRKEGRIYSCGRHLCEITKARAEYLTCDKHTCFEHFLSSTEGIWARLQDQRMIDEAQLAIWNYLFEDDFGAGGFYFQEVSEMWSEIQTKIDKERGL